MDMSLLPPEPKPDGVIADSVVTDWNTNAMTAAELREALALMPPPDQAGVSVVINAFNAMPYLIAAIGSVLNQTQPPLEVIVVDDGSTDGSADAIAAMDDPRIRLIRQANRGTAIAGNVGLLHCRGQWVARMDADDLSDPTRLQRQCRRFIEDPALVLVGSDFQYLGPAHAGSPIALPREHESIVEALRRGDHGLVHGSLMAKTVVMRKIGGYWEHPFFEDWDLFLRMAERGRLANIPEPLYQYRALATSISGARVGEMRLHYRYAIDAAVRRDRGQPAISLDDFRRIQAAAPVLHRAGERLDQWSLTHYRRAMTDWHGGRTIIGGGRLALSALINPARAIRRLQRSLRLRRSAGLRRSPGSRRCDGDFE